jgi:hypothetical protein
MAAAPAAAEAGKLPASGLKPDTVMASKADTSEIAYLGVWAPDAAACATVDNGGTDYVVATKISVRQGSNITIVTATPLVDGKVSLGTAEKPLDISMPTPDTLQLGTGAPLVRCTP